MKKFKLAVLFLFMCTCFIACGEEKNQEVNNENYLTTIPTSAPTSTSTPTMTPTPELSPTATLAPTATPEPTPTEIPEAVIPEGMVKSRLTGLWISEDTAMYRPYAVMINNIKVASPQSGLSAADILYEVLVEYGITRFMAVFEAQDALADTTKRIGSVRSARHYYVNLANECDAIYVHFGGTTFAYDKIKSANTTSVDGIMGGFAGQAFSRDQKIQAPHNVFLNYSVLLNDVFKSSLRSEWDPNRDKLFNFFEDDTTPANGQKADKVTIQFSQSVRPYLVYDKETGECSRYQFGVLHNDPNNEQPLTFKNIIVQYAKHAPKSNEYITIELDDAEGDGYYITNGVAIPIVWKRNETPNECHYYDLEGNELSINVGKTYIAIYPDDYRGGVIFE